VALVQCPAEGCEWIAEVPVVDGTPMSRSVQCNRSVKHPCKDADGKPTVFCGSCARKWDKRMAGRPCATWLQLAEEEEAERMRQEEAERQRLAQLRIQQEKDEAKRRKLEQEERDLKAFIDQQRREEDERRQKRIAEEKAANEKWLRENTKPCPTCNFSIKKIAGCLHMLCPVVTCGISFNCAFSDTRSRRAPRTAPRPNSTFSRITQQGAAYPSTRTRTPGREATRTTAAFLAMRCTGGTVSPAAVD
jgi:hypothetical protein